MATDPAVVRAAEARAVQVRERVAALMADALPAAEVRVEGERVVAEGRGLRARSLGLRWIGGELK